jgi:tRNA-specific 2-thiouridylase
VKTRHRQADIACRFEVAGAGRGHVVLGAPARAVTPGQYAVFYQGERCIGGGVISARSNPGRPMSPSLDYNSRFEAEGQ